MQLYSTYWTLQDLGDPLLLLHHVEVLPQIRRQGPVALRLWVAVVHAVQVLLLGVTAGQGQGQGPGRSPHFNQTHVLSSSSSVTSFSLKNTKIGSPQLQIQIEAVKATGVIFAGKEAVLAAVVTHVITVV